MSDEPKGYEQALGAVLVPPGLGLPEEIIRRMRGGCDEETERGDTYRNRALALVAQCRHLRHWDDLTLEEMAAIEKDIAEYEATKDDPYQVMGVYRKQINEWQAQEEKLAAAQADAARLRGLLVIARQWMEHADDCASMDDDFGCDCTVAGWKREIDAALAAAQPGGAAADGSG